MEALLQAVLYRHTCPTAEELLDYHLGNLTGTADEAVRRHVEICPHCTADLRDLIQLEFESQPNVTQTRQRTQLLQRMRQWLADLPLIPLLPQAAISLPTLRSGETPDTRIFESDAYRLAISVIRTPSSSSVTLEGNLIDQNDPLQTPSGEVQLVRYEDGEPIASETLDDFGLFTVAAVPSATYSLLIKLPTHSIWLPEFSV
ncbi:MAG: hypothetical protein U0175_12820 [Caldilineaceae bacterium]